MSALLTVVAMLAAQAPATAEKTAFFCLLTEYDVTKQRFVGAKPSPLNVLLAGHPSDVDRKPPIKTYDPDSLLNSEAFDLFAKDFVPGAQGYVVMTQGMAAKRGYMLTMAPKAGKQGSFEAVLGQKGSDARRHIGECFGPVGPFDEAGFDKDSSQ